MKKQLRGSLLLVLATLIWGSTFVAQDVGIELVGVFTFQAVRMLLGVLVLLPVIILQVLKISSGTAFQTKQCRLPDK